MNTRIHSFKVYLIESNNGRREGWSFHKPWGDEQGRDKVVMEMTLWDLLYKVNEGAKMPNGKSLVTKVDLTWLLDELARTGDTTDGKNEFERIAESNK